MVYAKLPRMELPIDPASLLTAGSMVGSGSGSGSTGIMMAAFRAWGNGSLFSQLEKALSSVGGGSLDASKVRQLSGWDRGMCGRTEV